MDYYEIARGPMAWTAGSFCVLGVVYRFAALIKRGKRLKRRRPAKSARGGLKSILRGLIPFGLHYMREHPIFTVVAWIFHLCLLITPVFLLAHIVLVYESWQIQWISLPDTLADVMTVLVLLGVLFFSIRRLSIKAVRSLTGGPDWILLALIAAVFLSGLTAYHHWGPYRPLLIAHIMLGEALLVMIPFSKLIHMILFFFTRGYLGAEYEIVLDGQYL
jgi:nitrate reductase gamma subunit